MNKKDYYALLGVSPDASLKQIKEAYRSKAFEFHPDRNQSPEAASMMQAINEAYAVLADSGKRQQYDFMRRSYGADAHRHFRRSYSEQDIFTNSDFQQIFEEMAQAFGLRGFSEIFKDYHGQGYRSFEYRKPGFYSKGFFFYGRGGHRPQGVLGQHASGMLGKLAQKLLQKAIGLQFAQPGRDSEDRIELTPEFAAKGGPYAYMEQARGKKLVVQIPPGIKQGQQIRLAGMGHEGQAGGRSGDLYLKVRIKQPMMQRLKSLLGM